MRIRAHHRPHRTGDAAQLHRVGADDAELHRITDRGPQLQAIDAQPHVRERATVRQRRQLGQQRFARLHGFGVEDELREIRVGQLRRGGQEEARAAAAGVDDVGGDATVLLHDRLQLRHIGGGCRERAAFRQPHIHHHFQPVGRREELLRHAREADDRQHEGGNRAANHDPAPADAPGDDAAEAVVGPRVVHIVLHRVPLRLRQQARAEIRHEKHRDEPREDQRHADNTEDVVRVFPGAGLREPDRQVAHCRHQGSGQHRESG